MVEFDERRKTGNGQFNTGDVFAKEDGRPVSAIISGRMNGVKIVQSNGRKWLASNRQGEVRLSGAVSASKRNSENSTLDIPKGCYLQVILNGTVRYNGAEGQALFDIDQLDAKDILGFELHSTATTPAQYNSTQATFSGSCGTVIIWTKAG